MTWLLNKFMKKTTEQKNYQVKKSSAGLGMFATQPIKKGKFIIEYLGPLITEEQANKKAGMYLFSLGNKWTIDGSSRKNTARYFNHSCRPNCEAWQYGNKVKIKSRRAIKAGEELTYNYGKDFFERIIGGAKHCRCEKHKQMRKEAKKNPTKK